MLSVATSPVASETQLPTHYGQHHMSDFPYVPVQLDRYMAIAQRGMRERFRLRAARKSVEYECDLTLRIIQTLRSRYRDQLAQQNRTSAEDWLEPELMALAAQAECMLEVLRHFLQLLDALDTPLLHLEHS